MSRQPPKPVRAGGSSLGVEAKWAAEHSGVAATHKARMGKLQVYFSIWREPMLWCFDEDHEKVTFDRCQQARDYAASHGFAGILIRSPPTKRSR